MILKLEWSEPAPPNEEIRYDHVIAESPLGQFTIEWKSWKDYDGRVIYLKGEYIGVENTTDEAKASAQTHFEALVNSCLVQ